MFSLAYALLPLLVSVYCHPIATAEPQSEDRAAPNVEFVFSGWEGPPLRVFGVEPPSARDDAPVIIVMHGTRRNADDYRDNWISLAVDYGFRVYAPEFDADRFKGAANYNLGALETQNPSPFDAIEPLFQYLRDERGAEADTYIMFGHSAGGQFVHRYICFSHPQNLRFAIAANAGWYTSPDSAAPWPYSLDKAPDRTCSFEEWFAVPLIVLLGEEDNDPQARSLRRNRRADLQGDNRFDRGLNFFSAAQRIATAENLVFRWQLQTVPGVAHDNGRMAEAAAMLIEHLVDDPPEGDVRNGD